MNRLRYIEESNQTRWLAVLPVEIMGVSARKDDSSREEQTQYPLERDNRVHNTLKQKISNKVCTDHYRYIKRI